MILTLLGGFPRQNLAIRCIPGKDPLRAGSQVKNPFSRPRSDFTYTHFFSVAQDVITRCEPIFHERFGPGAVDALVQRISATLDQFLYTTAFRQLYAKKVASVLEKSNR